MRLNSNGDLTEVEMKYSQNKTRGRTGNRWLLLAAMVGAIALARKVDP